MCEPRQVCSCGSGARPVHGGMSSVELHACFVFKINCGPFECEAGQKRREETRRMSALESGTEPPLPSALMNNE